MTSWSISRKLVGVLLVLIGGIWLVGVGIAALSIRHEIDEVFDSSLQETAQRLLPLAIDDLDEHEHEHDGEEERELIDPFPAREHKEHLHYQIRSASGQVLLRSHDAPVEPFPAPLKRGYFDEGGRPYFTEVSPDGTIFVQVAELPGERKEAIRAVWLGLMAPLFGLLPVAALVIYWTVKRATRPILEVQRQIGMRGGEDLGPIDPHGLPDELAPIIHDMNRLLERLKAALEAERSFAANSAHELRNPIAAARAQAEVIAEALRDSPDHVRAVQLIDMLGQLGRRIEKMLQLARAESGLGLTRTETDLVAVTRLVVADYARRPRLAKRLVFDSGPSETVSVTIDPDAVGIALQNLIDNALTHGTPGGTIEITIGPGATVRVINEGPVVNSKDLSSLRQRFERAGSKNAPGAGLGLSIVDEIMRQAGGSLELASPASGREDGFEARLVLSA
jgi:two-component system OmpR family sensor kinase